MSTVTSASTCRSAIGLPPTTAGAGGTIRRSSVGSSAAHETSCRPMSTSDSCHHHGPQDERVFPGGPGIVNLLDMIANKVLRLPTVNSKVVQSTGDLHHKIVILFLRISENVFDNATAFNPSNDMLNHNPDT